MNKKEDKGIVYGRFMGGGEPLYIKELADGEFSVYSTSPLYAEYGRTKTRERAETLAEDVLG